MKETKKMREILNLWIERAKIIFPDGKTEGSDLISLKDFIESFHQVYSSFRKEYDKLEKVNIGERINVYHYNDTFGRLLVLHLGKQSENSIVPEGFHFLTLLENDDKSIDAYYKDTQLSNFKIINEKLVSQDIWKGYLDLFEKYQELIHYIERLYNDHCIDSKRNNLLNIDIVPHLGSFINNIDEVLINLMYYSEMGPCYIMNLFIDFAGEEAHINYEKSNVIVDDQKLTLIDNSIYDNVFETLMIQRDKLKEYNLDTLDIESKDNIK